MLLEIKAFLSLYYFSEIDKEIASELLENIKKFNLLCLKNGKEISDAELTEEDFFLYIQDIINELKNVYTTLNWETKSIDIYEEECKVIMSKKENNDDDSVKKCFIATAAMGNYNHPIVIELRQFRDEWLLKRAWGVRFTKRYYEHGPKAANVIEKSTFLKKVVFILIVKPLQIVTKPLIRRANN